MFKELPTYFIAEKLFLNSNSKYTSAWLDWLLFILPILNKH